MQEAEEQDTCRICSAPAEKDQPLFYPCKCSGTIRYIHQDCLTTWLAHSKKKHCDVCKHPYSFTKVYAPDMPKRLPPVLLIRQLAKQSLFALLFGIRAIAVAIIWLAVLPWVTIWTWRMYFSMGDSTAWWISDRPRPPSASPSLPSLLFSTTSSNHTIPSSTSFFARISSHPSWLTLSSDIFAGQIIAALIVLTFVAVFLLREWISQNARPGIFDDEDIAEDRERLQPQAEQQQPPAPALPPRMPLIDHLAEAGRDPAGGPGRNAAFDNRPRGDHQIDERGLQSHPILRRRDGEINVGGLPPGPHEPNHTRLRLHPGQIDQANIPGDLLDSESQRRRAFSRRLHAARISGRRHKAAIEAGSPDEELAAIEPAEFEFTFRTTPRLPRRYFPEPRPPRYVPKESEVEPLPTHFPPVQLEPPASSIPFGLDLRTDSPTLPEDSGREDASSSLPTPSTIGLTLPAVATSSDASASGSNEWVSSFSSVPDIHLPPRLPIAIGPSVGNGETETVPPLPSSSRNSSFPSLPSPSLISYRAPEELEAGPSDYFHSEASSVEDEQEKYFRERTSSEEDLCDESPDVEIAENANVANRNLYPLDSEEDTEEDEDEDEEGVGDEEFEDEDDGEMGLENVNFAPEFEPRENERPPEGAAVAVPPPPPPQNGAGPAPLPEGNEDMDGNVEDDMEGAMEALGMRGPIYGVIQNAALMIFVLDTAIGLGVWIPFTIGKSTALLSLDPYRFLQLLHFPIRAMRLITDPIVDSIVFLLLQFVLPFLLVVLRRMAKSMVFFGSSFLAELFGQDRVNGIIQSFTGMYSRCGELLQITRTISSSWSESPPSSDISTFSRLTPILNTLVELTEPHFAIIGSKLRHFGIRLQATWERMALGQGPSEKAFAIALGYAVVGILLSIYLNILTVGNVRSAGRVVRNAVRQQLLVAKVAAFIFIELVTFPLGCGIVLDFCIAWMFPNADLIARVMYFTHAPLTATFYHWVAGTMFMYTFAVILSSCRGIMRPGAMWFIKDPQDQNSHPIRDILDRPTLVQLRKICISGVMYAIVVVCVVGTVSALLFLGNKTVMPVIWMTRYPFSNIPIDLLLLHQVLPYTMHYFRPRKVVTKVSIAVWTFLATKLRLSSYFFGGRYPSEEYPQRLHLLTFWRSEKRTDDYSNAVRDGGFRRVPNTDHIALARDMRATAPVYENGEPIDEAARMLIQAQDREAEKMKRQAKDDYTVVFIPPNFQYRIILFLVLLWSVTAVLVAFFIGIPLHLGRSIFKLFLTGAVHDGYSFLLGFYVLWACYLVGKFIDRLVKRRQRKQFIGARADLPFYIVKRALIWSITISYMIFFLGIVVPTLLSIVVELYIVLPIRFVLHPHMTPRIRIVDMWALGILYSNIALHVYQLQPHNHLAGGLQNIMYRGWTHPDPMSATKEVFVPAAVGLLGMILLPAGLIGVVRYLLPWLPLDNKFIFTQVYPGIFALAGFIRMTVVLFKFWSKWSQSIRDKEFLVEMRLRNLEPNNDEPEVSPAKEIETDYSSDN